MVPELTLLADLEHAGILGLNGAAGDVGGSGGLAVQPTAAEAGRDAGIEQHRRIELIVHIAAPGPADGVQVVVGVVEVE